MSAAWPGETTPVAEWEIDGWRIKTTQGKKTDRHPDDRKVWVASPGGDYRLLTLASLGAITRLWVLNEELLYPSASNGGSFRGGEMVMDFLRDCAVHGVESAAERNYLRPPNIRRLDHIQDAAA